MSRVSFCLNFLNMNKGGLTASGAAPKYLCVETQPAVLTEWNKLFLPFYHLEMPLTLGLSWFCLGWPAVVFIFGTQPAMPSDSYELR